MNALQSSLYTVAVALWVFSSGILSGRRTQSGRAHPYFTAFLVTEGFAFACEVLMAHPSTPAKAMWLGLRMGTALLLAPFLWLAVQEAATESRPALRSLGRRTLMMVGVGLTLTLPLIFSSHLGVTYANPHHATTALQARFIHGTMLACIGIFVIQGPYYLWKCRRLLLSRNASGERSSLGWAQLALLIVGTTWIVGVLRTLGCVSHAPAELSTAFAFAEVIVTVGAIYVMVRRVSLSDPLPIESARPIELADIQNAAGNLRTQTTAVTVDIPDAQFAEPAPLSTQSIAIVSHPAVAPTKYSKSNVDPAHRERIQHKLTRALGQDGLFRDSLLSLRSLSAALKENPHYVSQVINEDLNTNFYQLVSRYRIAEAKALIAADGDQTILEIALSVGFNSKSTFNTAFRRDTGMTPSEWRERATRS